jgi:hypothetical protein
MEAAMPQLNLHLPLVHILIYNGNLNTSLSIHHHTLEHSTYWTLNTYQDHVLQDLLILQLWTITMVNGQRHMISELKIKIRSWL